MPRTILIRDAMVISGPDEAAIADILIEDGLISRVGPGLSAALAAQAGTAPLADRIMDARGMMAVPGFASAHYHSHDTLLRGSFEPMPLESWFLHAVPPNYAKRSRDEIRARTLLGALDCLRGGITTIQDLVTVYPYDPDHVEAIVEAYREVGIRAVVAMQVADTPGQKGIPFWEQVVPEDLQRSLTGSVKPIGDADAVLGIVEAEFLRWRGTDARITWGFGPATPENCSTQLLKGLVDLAARHDARVFTHVYESKSMALNARWHYGEHGGSLIAYMDSIGMLNERLTMAHCVWLLPDEIQAVARSGASVALNPVSNLKTKSGVAATREMIAAGVRIGLGTDNCSCSDAQNMFQSMKLFCLLTAASHAETGRPDARDALDAATVGSARALGLEGRIGRIAPGQHADLSLLDLSDPALQPMNDPCRLLVYAECGRAVRHVMVGGEFVVENGRSTRIDEDALFDTIARLMPALRGELDRIRTRNAQVAPYLARAHAMTMAQDVGIDRFIATPRA
jgi:5-methylthioadenosine/S-adenosylhomocysteine deaminase